MSLIPLYGDIPDPVNDSAFYIVEEHKESDTVFRYTGRIGFGESKHAMEERLKEEGEGETTDDSTFITGYCVPYRQCDMRDFGFTYNVETNIVRVESYCRFVLHPEEAKRIPKNFVLEMPTYDEAEQALKRLYKDKYIQKDDVLRTINSLKEYFSENWDEVYLYFRCPRSKEGIAMSRAINYIFKDRPPIQIVYPLLRQIV